jgi:hypothetical protein
MKHFSLSDPSKDSHLNNKRRLRVLARNPVTCIVHENHVVAHKDPHMDGFDDLEDDELVNEGLQDLYRGIKGLPLKLNAVSGGLKDSFAYVRGGDASFRVFRHEAVEDKGGDVEARGLDIRRTDHEARVLDVV